MNNERILDVLVDAVAEDVATDRFKDEIAKDPVLRRIIVDIVQDAARGVKSAQIWVKDGSSRLWLNAMGRYLDEGGQL